MRLCQGVGCSCDRAHNCPQPASGEHAPDRVWQIRCRQSAPAWQRQARYVRLSSWLVASAASRYGNGFTPICGVNEKRPGFQLWRRSSCDCVRGTTRKGMKAKVKAIKDELRRRLHTPLAEQGKWLGSVVRGVFAYHAVPGNDPAIDAFRYHVINGWLRALRRRSQRHRMPWDRHSWPQARFRVTHSRREPGALAAPAGMPRGGRSAMTVPTAIGVAIHGHNRDRLETTIVAEPIDAQENSTLRATPDCRNFGLAPPLEPHCTASIPSVSLLSYKPL